MFFDFFIYIIINIRFIYVVILCVVKFIKIFCNSCMKIYIGNNIFLKKYMYLECKYVCECVINIISFLLMLVYK